MHHDIGAHGVVQWWYEQKWYTMTMRYLWKTKKDADNTMTVTHLQVQTGL